MVVKRTVWNPHKANGRTEYQNTENAVRHVVGFPGLTGLHTVWGYSKFVQVLDGDMDPDSYNYLEEDDKEKARKAVGTAPGLRQYIDWSPGKSLDKLFQIYNDGNRDKVGIGVKLLAAGPRLI